MTNNTARDLFLGALKRMIRHLEKEISSFERMFEGITLVLRPGGATAR
jgi:hypothetical protein